MYEVYVIQSESTGKIYIGSTKDLVTRLKRHNQELPYNKKSFTYKQRGPWVVVYREKCNDMVQAHIREKELKTARGRRFIKENLRP